MTSLHIPARQLLRRAALVVALLIGSSSAMTSMSSASMPPLASSDAMVAPVPVVTWVLPSDRAIMLIEGRNPENAGVISVVMRIAETDAAPTTNSADGAQISQCLPCQSMV